MSRFKVPPLPQTPPATPEPDPLLEKFRDDTIKGKKLRAPPRASASSGSDSSLIDTSAPDLDQAGGGVDWGIDDTGSW